MAKHLWQNITSWKYLFYLTPDKKNREDCYDNISKEDIPGVFGCLLSRKSDTFEAHSWMFSIANLSAEHFSVTCTKPKHFYNISSSFEPGKVPQCRISFVGCYREQIRCSWFCREPVKCNISRSHRECDTVGASGKTSKDCPMPSHYLTKRDVVTLMLIGHSRSLFIKH